MGEVSLHLIRKNVLHKRFTVPALARDVVRFSTLKISPHRSAEYVKECNHGPRVVWLFLSIQLIKSLILGVVAAVLPYWWTPRKLTSTKLT